MKDFHVVLICSSFLLTFSSFCDIAADLTMLSPPDNTDREASTTSSLDARSFPVACSRILLPDLSITFATFSWFKEKTATSF